MPTELVFTKIVATGSVYLFINGTKESTTVDVFNAGECLALFCCHLLLCQKNANGQQTLSNFSVFFNHFFLLTILKTDVRYGQILCSSVNLNACCVMFICHFFPKHVGKSSANL